MKTFHYVTDNNIRAIYDESGELISLQTSDTDPFWMVKDICRALDIEVVPENTLDWNKFKK